MSPEPAPRYIAFISYRHVQPDRGVAIWLHRALERYRVPRAQQRDGTPARAGTIFRDAEELSASADLSASIQEALRESKYLIVICSPRTPGSKWVNEEVSAFRQMGRGSRILPLLIEGEPHESFPRALLEASRAGNDGPGDNAEREPLAADLRPVPDESARRTRQTARLKLLAPLLGCTYAALARRDQEYQARRAWTIASSSLVLVLIFAALSVGLFMLYRSEQRATQTALGRALVSQSQLTHSEHPEQQELSVLLAVEGMRRLDGVGIRTSQADQAVRRAVSLQPRLLQHIAEPGNVREISASSSGRFLAAATEDGRTVLLAMGRRDPAATLPAMKSIASRFEGDDLFLTTDGRSVVTVDLGSGRVETLPVDVGGATAAAFGTDGRQVAAISGGGELTIWDLATGQPLLRTPLPGQAGDAWEALRRRVPSTLRNGVQELRAREVARTMDLGEDFSIRRRVAGPNGRFLMLTGRIDDSFSTYFYTPEQRRLGVHATGEVPPALYPGPDGGVVASVIDSSVSILEVPETPVDGTRHLAVLARIPAEGQVKLAALAGNGRSIATSAGPAVRVWDARTAIETCRVPHPAAPRSIALASTDRILLTAAADGVRWWECAPMRDEASLRGFDPQGTLHPDGSVAAGVGRKGVHLTDRGGHEVAVLQPSDRGGLTLVWSDDGAFLAAGRHGVRLDVWSWPGRARLAFAQNAPRGEPLAFGPDNRYLAVAPGPGSIDVIDLATGASAGAVKSDVAGRVALAAGGRLLSVRDFDDRQRLFDVANGTRLDPDGAVGAVVLLPAGARVAAWRDGKLWIGDPGLGQNVVSIDVAERPRLLAFSPAARFLGGVVGGQVRIWSATGEPVAAMALDDAMLSVAFSPDERDVAAGGGRLVQVWDIAAATEVARMPVPPDIDDPSSRPDLKFSRDGRRLALANGYRRVVWVWQPRDMMERACTLVRRLMTPGEWQAHVRDGDPSATCPR